MIDNFINCKKYLYIYFIHILVMNKIASIWSKMAGSDVLCISCDFVIEESL